MSAREELERMLAQLAVQPLADGEPAWKVDHWPLGGTRLFTGSFYFLLERAPQPLVCRVTCQGARSQDVADRAMLAALRELSGRTA